MSGFSRALGNRAGVLSAKGELDEAWRLHGQEERLCRQVGSVFELATCLENQALLAERRGDPGVALRRAEEAFRLAETHGLVTIHDRVGPVLQRLRTPPAEAG